MPQIRLERGGSHAYLRNEEIGRRRTRRAHARPHGGLRQFGRRGKVPTTTSAARADVLAVKIDNVAAARPPTGLEKADIVYVEQVEAGLSRILAAYSSDVPSVIGPVRSARETDLELLRQFDEPTLAYSGAQSALRPSIEAAPSTRCRRRRHRTPISAAVTAPRRTICTCARRRSRTPPPG